MGIFVKLFASILPTNKSWPMQLHNLQHIIDKVIDETNNKIIFFFLLY